MGQPVLAIKLAPDRDLRGPQCAIVLNLQFEFEIHAVHHLLLRFDHVFIKRAAVLRDGIGLYRKACGLLHVVGIRIGLGPTAGDRVG